MKKLNQEHCKPCEDGAPPMSPSEAREKIKDVENWTLVDASRLEKIFTFKDFKEALDFVNKVGAIAEAEGHHPNITIFDYKKVKIELYTHSVDGLSENDFILASLINEITEKTS